MTHTKRILVAVTGMSPQIITETLYSLVTEHRWIPHEIHVLTTGMGAQKITQALLGDSGFFARICQEYHLPEIQFPLQNIHIIEDNQGNALDDIRSPEQNNAAADKIVRFIHDLCLIDNTELHVSIAGGRKSMGFYIGYALSLFGRKQDRLSHVLVEADFENNPQFFYPTLTTFPLDTPSGIRDASSAKVMLANIPFVRMREGLPKLQLADQWNFTQAVELTQQNLQQLHLIINPKKESIQYHNLPPIKLQQRRFCVYWAVVLLALEGKTKIALHNGSKDLTYFKEKFVSCRVQLDKTYKGNGIDAKQKRKELENLDEDEIKTILQEEVSRLKKEIKKYLGDYGSAILINSEGKNNYKCYHFSMPIENIQILE
ncbi:CRISPR-associated ring nuclease Csm6 [Pelistega sp. MC2]|uniref:CRISPR-associated ring nuclease Csm6 n=1 Tax=Pelistega sp. MC2 TaxID=1720297 RepID=UPI0008DAA9EA|nr:CRISPR-associated ring nuclease Csm6 [Pelistega sp. MC2]